MKAEHEPEKRKRYSAHVKTKVMIDALRSELTTSKLTTKHGVQQANDDWRSEAPRPGIPGIGILMQSKTGLSIWAKNVYKLHARITKLVMERDF